MEQVGILIVEDEVIVAADLMERLKTIGYPHTKVVTSGEEALDALKSFEAGLVLMDIGLKGDLDGIETAARIREDASIPVIYLTAYADERTLERAEVTEPYGYLLKPVGDRELHSSVKMALYKHKMERRLKEERERFRIVADYTIDWEYWWSEDKGYLYVSPSCRTITGYQAEEFYRDPRIMERILHPQERESWGLHVRRVMNGGETGPHEFRIRTRSGEERWIQGLYQLVIDERGKNLGVRGSNRDITKLKKAEGELKRLRGILPICASCKKVRDDKGYWQQVEEYIREHSEAEFSHGLCPECARRFWPDMPISM